MEEGRDMSGVVGLRGRRVGMGGWRICWVEDGDGL